MRYIRKIRREGLQTFNDVEKQFFSELVFLLKTFFFVFIGVSIRFSNVWTMVLGVLLTVIIYIIRIPIVKFSVRQPLPTLDLTVMAAMVPKGLAAAVLAAVPMHFGMPSGGLIRDVVYAVILTSIVLTSVLIPLLEKVPMVRAFYAVIFRRRSAFTAGREVEEAVKETEETKEVARVEETPEQLDKEMSSEEGTEE